MKKTRLERVNIAAVLVIFLLLGLHLTIMHTYCLRGLAPYGNDSDAMRNVLFRDGRLPFTVMYVVLLAAVLFHGFYGLRTILMERLTDPARQRRLTTVLILVGAGLFAFGTWAAIAAHMFALAPRG
jgi:succinate dehydrogenase hydrophobic anchor subunit